jgi:hypothetical protein
MRNPRKLQTPAAKGSSLRSDSGAHRARAQEPSVRGLGRWRRPMGNHLLPHRHRKAQQRRALCLAQRRPAAHDRRSSRQPPRRTLALELATNKRQGLSHVQGMDAYAIERFRVSDLDMIANGNNMSARTLNRLLPARERRLSVGCGNSDWRRALRHLRKGKSVRQLMPR